MLSALERVLVLQSGLGPDQLSWDTLNRLLYPEETGPAAPGDGAVAVALAKQSMTQALGKANKGKKDKAAGGKKGGGSKKGKRGHGATVEEDEEEGAEEGSQVGGLVIKVLREWFWAVVLCWVLGSMWVVFRHTAVQVHTSTAHLKQSPATEPLQHSLPHAP